MKGESPDAREGGDETIAVPNDEELMDEIKQGLHILEKKKAGYYYIIGEF